MSTLEKPLIVSSSPHAHTDRTVTQVMGDVLIALVPAAIAGVYYFGYWALLIMVVSVLYAVGAEALTQLAMKRPVTSFDLSAAVTGLLVAFNLPPTAPLWLPMIGSVFAVVIVKQIFGGLGNNFLNPALAARAMLLVSFAKPMTTWIDPAIDAIASATPLAQMAEGTMPQLANLFFGNVAGCIGETSALALLIGAAYLLIRGVISWRIPAAFIGTFAVLTAIFGGMDQVLPQLFAGGLMLGAFFMATDYVTSPVTPVGRLIFGCGCGLLTFIIRRYGGYPEGVSFAILLMNVCTPLIERYTKPRVFGEVKSRA